MHKKPAVFETLQDKTNVTMMD